MALGFFTGDNAPESYEARERRRRLAEALIAQSGDTSPVQSWTQGAARLAQALSGNIQQKRLDSKDKESSDAYNRLAMAMFGGGAMPSPAMPAPAGGAPAASGGPMASLINSESGGNWQAQNDAVGAGGKVGHFGRLQFGQARLEDAMRAGVIPQGTTPQQFMANPEMQKAVEAWHFSDIDKNIQSGPAGRAVGSAIAGVPVTPEGLRAVAHLGGVGGMNKFVQSGGQYNPADANGTTLIDYLKRHGGAPANLDGLPPGPVPSNAPPQSMAYAPASQAINAAAPQPRPQGQQLAQAVSPTSPQIPAPQPTGNVQAAMMAILSDPRFSPQQKQQAMQMYSLTQREDGVSPVDLGDKIALMNKRGQVTGYLPKQRNPISVGEGQRLVDPVTGREVAGADGGKSPTVQRIKQPDGSEVAVQWDKQKGEWVPLKAPEGGNPVANPKLTEVQSKDVGFYNRGTAILPRLEKQDKALTESMSAIGGKVPVVGNFLKSDAYRQAEQTGRELLAVILRKDTGAAVTDSEMTLYSNMYLPQPGDDAATIRQKQEGRKTAIEGIRMGLGTAEILFKQREALDAAKQAAGQPQQQQPESPPKVRRYNPQTGRIE